MMLEGEASGSLRGRQLSMVDSVAGFEIKLVLIDGNEDFAKDSKNCVQISVLR